MNRIVFRDANLLDGEHPAKPNSSVVVEGNRIVTVTTEVVTSQPGDRDIDCSGLTLMPGMVSGHYHSTYRGVSTHSTGVIMPPLGLERAPAYHAYIAADNVRLALEAGVTSVVGANEAFDVDPSLRDAIAAGLLPGPRIVAGSRELITTADSNDCTPWWWESNAAAAVRLCDGPDEFRKAVREEIRRGAEIIKLFCSGGHGIRLPAEISSITQPELSAAVEAAHALGKRTRAHVASKEGIMKCLEAGVDVIDHGDGLDEECVREMAKLGTILVPSLHSPARIQAAGSRSFEEDLHSMGEILPVANEAGISICLGDDYGTAILPHGEYGQELAVYVEYVGISPLEAVRWATVNGGRLVGLDDLGRIEEGYLADMVVVKGDPSVDVSILGDTANIATVMYDGRLFFPAAGE